MLEREKKIVGKFDLGDISVLKTLEMSARITHVERTKGDDGVLHTNVKKLK